jgi:hypothetical protein
METLEFTGVNAVWVLNRLCERSRKEVLCYFPQVDPWPLFWALRGPAGLGWVFRTEGSGVILSATKGQRNDVWSISMLTTDNFRQLAKPLTKRIRNHIIPLFADLGAKRLECCSLAEPWPTHKWMRHLGARQDQVLRRHGRNDEDFILFVWDI